MTLTVDMIRQAIASVKAVGEKEGYESAEGLAIAWFKQEPSFHGNWDLLMPEIQEMWVKFAQAAIREIETGEPTPE
jgi:hypothetical protein